MSEVTVDYTLSADQVNALDATPVTLWSHVYDSVVYVPKRALVWRNAGTAYAMSPTSSAGVHQTAASNATAYVPGDRTVADTISQVRELIVYDLVSNRYSGRTDRGNILFRIPLDGVLTAAGDNQLVILPEPGLILRPGANSFMVESPVALASGTGTLRIMLVLEQVAF